MSPRKEADVTFVITRKEWAKKHADYKSRPGDKTHPSMLVYNPKTGATELWPVAIVAEAGHRGFVTLEDDK
jgi:hypothetical protein